MKRFKSREFKKIIRGLGGDVVNVHKTGHCRAEHPVLGKSDKFHNGSEDIPRCIYPWIKALARFLSSEPFKEEYKLNKHLPKITCLIAKKKKK